MKKIIYKILTKILKTKDIPLKIIKNKNISIGQLTIIDSYSNIGNYTYIGRNCNITKSNIGRYCSIANNVSIGQGEHSLDKISTSSLFYDDSFKELTKKECTIGNDVWIGTDSVVLRGVKISNGAVIGANSTVTNDVPPFAIVAGSPARVIRYRFDEQKIDEIIDSKWWDNDLEGGAKTMIKGMERL